jgi:hypothetical protein
MGMVVAPLHLAEASGSESVLSAFPLGVMFVGVETLPPLLIRRRLLDPSMLGKLIVPCGGVIPEAVAIDEEMWGGFFSKLLLCGVCEKKSRSDIKG